MNTKIREALASLDGSNGEHWTSDGLPRLEVMKQLIGEAVSRAQITDAAKEFRRGNQTLTSPAVETVAPPAPTPVVTTPTEETVGVVTEETVADDAVKDDKSAQETVEREFAAAQKDLHKAQARMHKANRAMDAVIEQLANAAGGRNQADDIKAYQKSQLAQRGGKQI